MTMDEIQACRDYLIALNRNGEIGPSVYKQELEKWDQKILDKKRIREMRTSLEKAVSDCGGDVKSIMSQVDAGMTVTELMEGLGPNRVRFTHVPPEKNEEYYGQGSMGEVYSNAGIR